MVKIIVLDGHTLNPGDQTWEDLDSLGNLTVYDRTPNHLILERAKEANIIITNKTPLTAKTIYQLPLLKCICVAATGYNVVNVEAAKEKGIPVSNVKGYSSISVAQHVFALVLNFCNQVEKHNADVQNGLWQNAKDWCFWQKPIIELNNKTMGIYGLGQIGQEVAKLALAFGMNVMAVRRDTNKIPASNIQLVDTNELLAKSDFLTLHTPLNMETEGFIHFENLQQMKPSAFLINTGRGALVVEEDLKKALENNIIAGAALDVLSTEPPVNSNVLIGVKNCIITPHQAWASLASRKRLMDLLVENVRQFILGKPINVVNF